MAMYEQHFISLKNNYLYVKQQKKARNEETIFSYIKEFISSFRNQSAVEAAVSQRFKHFICFNQRSHFRRCVTLFLSRFS